MSRRYDRDRALEIALRNAEAKILAGYTAEQDATDPTAWTVTKPDGETYRVHLFFNPADRNEYRVYCECKFSGNGFTNWTCSHGEICRECANAAYYREVDQIIYQAFAANATEEYTFPYVPAHQLEAPTEWVDVCDGDDTDLYALYPQLPGGSLRTFGSIEEQADEYEGSLLYAIDNAARAALQRTYTA